MQSYNCAAAATDGQAPKRGAVGEEVSEHDRFQNGSDISLSPSSSAKQK